MKRLFGDHGPTPWSTFFSTASTRARDVAIAAVLGILLTLAAAAGRAAPAGTDGEIRVTLSDALALALDHASAVEAAEHDSLAAEQVLRAAKSAWFPSLALGANAIGMRPEDTLGLGFLEIAPDWHSIYATNASLRYPVFVGGRRINEIRRSREGRNAATAQVATARLHSAYRCRQAYIGLLVAERLARASEASLSRVEIIRNDVNNLFANGLADSVDILETELSIRRVRRLVEGSRNDRRNASATLARSIGVDADRRIVPIEPVPTPRPESDIRLTHPDTSILRPELVTLDHQIEAARYRHAGAKATYWPAINGLGGLAVVRPDLGQPDVKWQDIWFVGLTLSWELNLGGNQFAQSAQALEQMKSLENTRKDLEDSLALQSRIAWNNIQLAYDVYEISREEYGISRRRFGLAKGVATEGRMTVNRLLELEAELTETEQQFEAARLHYFAAITEYLYAIGSQALWEGM